MKLTLEQEKIIAFDGDMKINAVAGSGKTSTLVEYARARPNARMLYLVFNKSVKQESQQKFAKNNIRNVTVETAHSLAYREIVVGSDFKVKPSDFKLKEVIDILEITGFPRKHDSFIIANHVLKFISYFCNSPVKNVKDLNYISALSSSKALEFVTENYEYIEKYTRKLLAKMYNAEVEITHDFYLKMFQVSQPVLDYDVVLFDEGQDASGSILDIFCNQKATKVIVGDTHQQIYAWRFAVNSLDKVDVQNFELNTSFRFGAGIANLATEILRWKLKFIPEYTNTVPVLTGAGGFSTENSKAVIARTNISLLAEAIRQVSNSDDPIYFEGNIQSYTYASEGTSLYDVLNLWKGSKDYIKDPLIKQMLHFEELKDYVDKVDDVQIKNMITIVEEYGSRIPSLIQKVKSLQVSENEKNKAAVIYSTVHKSKGMEYDHVELTEDFTTYMKLKKVVDKGVDAITASKINEEINSLYVAITRAKRTITIPRDCVPFQVGESEEIRLK